jgi:hypothetical protein
VYRYVESPARPQKTEDDPEGGGALVRDMLAAKKQGEAAVARETEVDAAPKEKGIILGRVGTFHNVLWSITVIS